MGMLLQKTRADGAAGPTHRLENHIEQTPKTILFVSLPHAKTLDLTREESRGVVRDEKTKQCMIVELAKIARSQTASRMGASKNLEETTKE